MASGDHDPAIAAREEYWAKVYAKPKERPSVSAEVFQKLLLQKGSRMNFQGKPFDIDSENEEAISLLSQYFTGDKRYSQGGRSLEKGICLMGPVGTGKTFLFEVIHQVLLEIHSPICLRIVHVNEIERLYSTEGAIIFDRYGRTFRQKTQNERQDFSRPISVVLDDLGTEEGKANHFGNRDVISDLIIERYQHIRMGMITHCTTNLGYRGIVDRYGDRCFDRMMQMMDFIQINGKSRRA